MIITLTEVSKGRHESALPRISAEYRSGRASLAVAETEQRPSVLGLIASGRMRPDSGEVRIDDAIDLGRLRASIALVDAPEVNDPSGDVSVFGVVAEELMFAGRPSGPLATKKALIDLDVQEWRNWTIGTVPAIVRIRLLTELAIMREDVEGLVLTAPDRHGGDPTEWWGRANELAQRGYAVLVIAGVASATALGIDAAAGTIFHGELAEPLELEASEAEAVPTAAEVADERETSAADETNAASPLSSAGETPAAETNTAHPTTAEASTADPNPHTPKADA
jgi:hypothetical protein